MEDQVDVIRLSVKQADSHGFVTVGAFGIDGAVDMKGSADPKRVPPAIRVYQSFPAAWTRNVVGTAEKGLAIRMSPRSSRTIAWAS